MGTEDSTADSEEVSPFQATAEYDATPADMIQELLEIWVITPAKIIWDDYRGRFAVLMISFYILMGTVGTVLVPQPTLDIQHSLVGPFETLEFPLGTNRSGKGMLAMMVHGTPNMFKMMISGTLFGGMMGLAVGLIAGYKGGTLDKALMTITDITGSIPGLPLLLILVALIQPTDPFLVGIVLNVQGWVGGSRGIRSQAFAIRKKEYVEASESMGMSTSNILFKDFLPELMPMIGLGFLSGATAIIHASVGLYFIGVLPYSSSTTNWGVVLNDAYNSSGALYNLDAAHWLLVPVITLTMLTFSFVMLAQAFDQVWNPRVRARHEARKQAREEQARLEEEVDEDDPSDMSRVGVQ